MSRCLSSQCLGVGCQMPPVLWLGRVGFFPVFDFYPEMCLPGLGLAWRFRGLTGCPVLRQVWPQVLLVQFKPQRGSIFSIGPQAPEVEGHCVKGRLAHLWVALEGL